MPLRLLLEPMPTDAGSGVSVRLDGPPPELDQVEFVTYLLQSLAPNPLRHVRERSTGFRLGDIGRHVLGVQARVHRRDGSLVLLEQ
ncbi:MAG: hypothetical protein LKM32_00650 [Chiayiivirga sp.]|jgi:hypothetical protein|uniref:pYEATS domain-containing protein n=1 Tax=Chiayiivirga sp. TaxID=2041042 RepID=UPI0025C6C192|nr:pYEATS domain-containing protein [Chiayiivirga sp.]MCI1711250.1 hypothetical protein [Chiayiivirga sp.]MCI1727946.1 hypothetical protein [Chiayiivirga sp.]